MKILWLLTWPLSIINRWETEQKSFPEVFKHVFIEHIIMIKICSSSFSHISSSTDENSHPGVSLLWHTYIADRQTDIHHKCISAKWETQNIKINRNNLNIWNDCFFSKLLGLLTIIQFQSKTHSRASGLV